MSKHFTTTSFADDVFGVGVALSRLSVQSGHPSAPDRAEDTIQCYACKAALVDYGQRYCDICCSVLTDGAPTVGGGE